MIIEQDGSGQIFCGVKLSYDRKEGKLSYPCAVVSQWSIEHIPAAKQPSDN